MTPEEYGTIAFFEKHLIKYCETEAELISAYGAADKLISKVARGDAMKEDQWTRNLDIAYEVVRRNMYRNEKDGSQ